MARQASPRSARSPGERPGAPVPGPTGSLAPARNLSWPAFRADLEEEGAFIGRVKGEVGRPSARMGREGAGGL